MVFDHDIAALKKSALAKSPFKFGHVASHALVARASKKPTDHRQRSLLRTRRQRPRRRRAAEKRDELAPSQAVPLGVAAIPDSNLLLSHRAWAGCDVNHAPDTRDEHQRIMRAIQEREG
jgi:hypothetical protein